MTSTRARVGALLLGFCVIGVVPAAVRAQPPASHTPVSHDAAGNVSGAAFTLGLGLTLYALPNTPAQHASWQGGILLDDVARDGLRLHSDEGRRIADSVSDALLISSIALTGVVDGLVAPLVQNDWDLTWQAETALAAAIGFTLWLGEIVKRGVGRARPYELVCATDASAPACRSESRFESFFSLHSAVAFAAAGVSCALHVTREMYGDATTDALACSASIGLALTTGTLRIIADAHWLSDVLVGALIGFAVGYATTLLIVPARVPTASIAPSPAPLVGVSVAPSSAPTIGFSMTFAF